MKLKYFQDFLLLTKELNQRVAWVIVIFLRDLERKQFLFLAFYKLRYFEHPEAIVINYLRMQSNQDDIEFYRYLSHKVNKYDLERY